MSKKSIEYNFFSSQWVERENFDSRFSIFIARDVLGSKLKYKRL
jgi:hypothetical protein